MQSVIKSVAEPPTPVSARNLTFVVETEPWLRIFLRNLADVFRPAPPKVWVTALPAEYWADALVNRPIAWSRIRQSFLGHTLVVLWVYWMTLLWLNRPQVLPQELPRTTIAHYQLSEYLPAVNAHREKQAPPARERAQAPDPEYAAQEIVSVQVDHTSMQQTIVHPNPNLLTQDVPLPNIMAWTRIPAAPVSANRPLQNLPLEIPQIAAPAQPLIPRSHLTFPVPPQPDVVAPAASVAPARVVPAIPSSSPDVVPPASSVAAAHHGPVLPMSGPVVIAPAQLPAPHSGLQIAAQAPEVAPPAAVVASRRSLSTMLPESAPQIIAPTPSAAARNLSTMSLAGPTQAVVPPSQPISGGGTNSTAMGQLLVLNARPVAPVGPLAVPEGNHRGEFAAGPAGRPDASARPELAAGDSAANAHPGADSTPANIYVAAPPGKVVGDSALVAASTASIPPVRARGPSRTPADRFDSEIFGLRRRYSVRLSMPNLNSAIGSWIMRFARLNSEPGHEEEISAPEPLRKVDPAYPASLMHDRIEGVVILYAVIHSDGSVADVRVLEGFEPRLDENARTALEQWRFRPGTRDGVPVDVEAVVHVPFRVPKAAF
jgi:TonB family protein